MQPVCVHPGSQFDRLGKVGGGLFPLSAMEVDKGPTSPRVGQLRCGGQDLGDSAQGLPRSSEVTKQAAALDLKLQVVWRLVMAWFIASSDLACHWATFSGLPQF